MLKFLKNFLLLAVIAISGLTQAGCFFLVGAAAGVGSYVWLNGALEQNLDASAARVHDAALRALKKQKLSIVQDKDDRLQSRILAEFASGENVHVDIDALTEQSSKIRIRVGIMGNRAKSETILAAVKRYLD